MPGGLELLEQSHPRDPHPINPGSEPAVLARQMAELVR